MLTHPSRGMSYVGEAVSMGILGATKASSHIPVKVRYAEHHFKVISSGSRHACSIDSEHRMHCWGIRIIIQSINLQVIHLRFPGLATTCFVELESSVVKCETIKLTGESELSEKGEITLPDFDWDTDGKIDSQDVLPRNPTLSAYCRVGYYGSHFCQPRRPDNTQWTMGQLFPEMPLGSFQPDEGTDYA